MKAQPKEIKMVVKRDCPHCEQPVVLFKGVGTQCPICKGFMLVTTKGDKDN